MSMLRVGPNDEAVTIQAVTLVFVSVASGNGQGSRKSAGLLGPACGRYYGDPAPEDRDATDGDERQDLLHRDADDRRESLGRFLRERVRVEDPPAWRRGDGVR
jgi:hypothetical protein